MNNKTADLLRRLINARVLVAGVVTLETGRDRSAAHVRQAILDDLGPALRSRGVGGAAPAGYRAAWTRIGRQVHYIAIPESHVGLTPEGCPFGDLLPRDGANLPTAYRMRTGWRQEFLLVSSLSALRLFAGSPDEMQEICERMRLAPEDRVPEQLRPVPWVPLAPRAPFGGLAGLRHILAAAWRRLWGPALAAALLLPVYGGPLQSFVERQLGPVKAPSAGGVGMEASDLTATMTRLSQGMLLVDGYVDSFTFDASTGSFSWQGDVPLHAQASLPQLGAVMVEEEGEVGDRLKVRSAAGAGDPS